MVDQPRTVTPPHGHPVVARETPPQWRADRRWLKMQAEPTLVRTARDFAIAEMAGAGVREEALVGDVRLLVSEAVTNAMRAAERYAVERGLLWQPYEFPVALRVECRPLWIHLLVIDPDPVEPEPEERGPLDELGGRGFTIMDEFAALRWFKTGTYGKTLHVIATRPRVTLTPDEISRLKRRVIM